MANKESTHYAYDPEGLERRILEYVYVYTQHYDGKSPSLVEIQQNMGLSCSRTTIGEAVLRLIKKEELISVGKGRGRQLIVPDRIKVYLDDNIELPKYELPKDIIVTPPMLITDDMLPTPEISYKAYKAIDRAVSYEYGISRMFDYLVDHNLLNARAFNELGEKLYKEQQEAEQKAIKDAKQRLNEQYGANRTCVDTDSVSCHIVKGGTQIE